MPLHWRHNDHNGVSNHQPHHCLLKRLFRRISRKTSKLRITGLCMGNSPGPVNSPHKGPVTRKMFPFDDVNALCPLRQVGSCRCQDGKISAVSYLLYQRYCEDVLTISLKTNWFDRKIKHNFQRLFDYQSSFGRISLSYGMKKNDCRSLARVQFLWSDVFTVLHRLKHHHDDAIKWKLFPRYWPFVRGIRRSSVNCPQKASDAEL